MMNIFSKILVLTLSLGAVGAKAGTVKNGGDIIFCDTDRWWRPKLVFLDWAVAMGNPDLRHMIRQNGEGTLAGVIEPFLFVHAALKRQSPELAEDFSNFYMSFFDSYVGRSSNQKKYVWQQIKGEALEEIDDEDFSDDVLVYCGSDVKMGSANNAWKAQLIVRTEEHGKVFLKYNLDFLKNFYSDKFQMSFFLVHEWLWNISPRASVSRSVNMFLHSHEAQTMLKQDFENKMIDFGLKDFKLPQ